MLGIGMDLNPKLEVPPFVVLLSFHGVFPGDYFGKFIYKSFTFLCTLPVIAIGQVVVIGLFHQRK